MIYGDKTRGLIERLQRSLPQGILLSGPDGVGLGSAATDIARAHTKHFFTVRPDEKGTIGIDAVRELYALGRSRGSMTLFVIDDADTMGIEAQNALLKLLEEPGESVRFILTSHAPERLLPTVHSRVIRYGIGKIDPSQTTALLDELKVTDPTKRSQLLFIADGLPAALTRYATTPKLFTTRASTVRDAREYLQGSREARLLTTARYKNRQDALGLVMDMRTLVRRSIEANPKTGTAALDMLIEADAALQENASVRLTLTRLALTL